MSLIEAIDKREDVEPSEGKSQYGDVDFADEKNKKYPIDTEDHIRAAWNYINKSANAGKYAADDVKTIKGKIVAAWKRKIDKDGPPSAAESASADQEDSYIISASATTTFNGEAPGKIIYMPRGEWTIHPSVDGQPKEVTVTVNEQTAAVLQNDFQKRLAAPVRPTGGFDHKPGPAAFIPKGFSWDESKGVVLDVDWTRAGKEAIEGRNYSYFSPTFLLSTDKVAGLSSRGEIGSLTNNPAFEQIERIAAERADDLDDEPDPDDYTMSEIAKKLTEFNLITATQAEDAEAVVQAVMALHTELAGTRAANAALRNENATLRAEAERVKAKEADSIIEAAIADGRIPPKSPKLIDYWRTQLIAQPDAVKEVIASLPANPVLKPLIEVKAGDSKAGISRSMHDLVHRQKQAVAEVMATNHGMTNAQAFNKAREERPDLFPAEL